MKPNQEGIDVGFPGTRAMLDALAADPNTTITQTEVDIVKALAEQKNQEVVQASDIAYARLI
jgi:hypothetical protein